MNAQSLDAEDQGKEMEIGWTLFRGHVQMMKMDDDSIFLEQLYGDNVFEKCGINRDGAGEVGKPRYFNGKRHF